MSDLALSIVLGVALAAATGFRVFLPMLIVSVAAYTGHLHLDDGFAWLGTRSALMMLSVAALAEVLAYYIPVVDNLLDTLATPAAFVAGTIVSAAVMIDAPPMVKWTAAVIAGGGFAGLTQGLTGILRAHSTVLTAGLGNPVIATAELGGAVLISFLALAAPVAAIVLFVLFLFVAMHLIRRRFRGDKSSTGVTYRLRRLPCLLSRDAWGALYTHRQAVPPNLGFLHSSLSTHCEGLIFSYAPRVCDEQNLGFSANGWYTFG